MDYPDDPGWWKERLPIKEKLAKAGFGQHTLTGLSAMWTFHRLSDAQFDQLLWSDFLIWTNSDAEKNIVQGLKSIGKDEQVKTLVLARRELDTLSNKYDKDEARRMVLRNIAERLRKGEATDEQQPDSKTAEVAFGASEQRHSNGRHPSDSVTSIIRQQYLDYCGPGKAHSHSYLAPYTTIVGPSGIGKSFAVRQLAVRHGIFVAYSNLGPRTSRSFPRPVQMGRIPNIGDLDSMTAEWKLYLQNQMQLTEASQSIGITPSGLFSLLTTTNREIIKHRNVIQALLTQGKVLEANKLKVSLTKVKVALTEHGLNVPSKPSRSNDPVIICFDESSTLLDGVSDSSFRALRRAAKELMEELMGLGEKPRHLFFIVLLDTTSKISNFAPPNQHDHSAKFYSARLFAPIYEIDSFNIFAPEIPPDPLGSEESGCALFSYGRPLWAALLRAGYSAQDLVDFAIQKLSGYKEAPTYALSLLSYRLHFYISSPTLAEGLVASMMRYMIAIADDRNTINTTQPSEPILAFASSKILLDPQTRLSSIRSWVSNLHSGAINPGDIGEQVTTLVLIFAWDQVADPRDKLPKAYSLEKFITSLLGAPQWNEINRVHGRHSGIKEIFSDGMVFFNHMVRITMSPSMEMIRNAYSRGFAFFMPPNFAGTDIGIPIKIGGTNQMGLFLIQIKNRKTDSDQPGLWRCMQEDLWKAEDALKLSADPNMRGIVGFVMCLRSSIPPRFLARHSKVQDGPHRYGLRSAKKGSAEQKGKNPDTRLANPVLLGIAFGCDEQVYPCLSLRSQAEKPKGMVPKKRRHEGTPRSYPDTGEAEMSEIRHLLKDILTTWPHSYSKALISRDYAQALLDPFLHVRDRRTTTTAGGSGGAEAAGPEQVVESNTGEDALGIDDDVDMYD